MAANLTVMDVKLPSPLRAPCPLTVLVSIQNIGSDPADPVPYVVTIDLGLGESSDTHFEAIVTTPEDQRLTTGRTIVVPVEMKFPCTSPVDLTATVDPKPPRIPNNDRTAPSLKLPGLTTTPVPWLTAALRIGISDAAGTVTFDPDGFCPGSAVVAEIVITSKGCRASKASTTEVTLEDANATPPARLASQAYSVPALAPGSSHTRTLSFATPNSPAGTSGTLGVRVSADANLANPDQCDRASLGVFIAKPFSAGAAPRLALTVGGAGMIRPGEVPTLSWTVRNDCTQIGTADAKILFGMPPTELHKTTLAIPLHALVGEDLIPADLTIPMTIASTFWAVGVKSLELEVIGNGSGGGPYRISVPLIVIPEPIDATWWTWGMPPTAFWKSSYAVTGTFSNLGLVTMTLTALTALEHPTDVMDTSQDATAAPLAAVFAAPAMPGASVTTAFVRL
jgi:hypothetical protein